MLAAPPFFDSSAMRVVLQPASAGRKTVNIITKMKKRHWPEQTVSKIQQADWIPPDGGAAAVPVRELNVT